MLRSSNPTMNVFQQPGGIRELAVDGRPLELGEDASTVRPNVMTVQGTINVSFILITLCAGSALGAWMLVQANPGLTMPVLIGGLIGSLVLALIGMFVKRSSPLVAPLYAIAEGAFLGAFSLMIASMLSSRVPGVGETTVLQAIGLTFGVFFAMLIMYSTRLIRPGKVFTACVIAGSMGIGLFYIAALAGSLFGFDAMREMISIQNASPFSIGFSVFAVVMASLFLILDFKAIEEGARAGLPRYMEWYAGLALLITLAWLYFEILKLLAKLRSND